MELDHFMIEMPAKGNYRSDQSGMIGLGPSSEFNEPNVNMVGRLNELHDVPEIITYNITFTGEHNHRRDKDVSYVQLGPFNKALEPFIA